MSYQPASAKLRPSGLWYLFGALAIAAGIGAFLASIFIGLARMSDTVDNFTRFTVGSEGVVATVDFARPGTYTLYYEYPSGATRAQQGVPDDLAVTITGIDAAAVPFRTGGNEVSFSISGGKAGRSAGEFTLPAAGKYDIQVTGGAARAPLVMAVGRGVLATLGRTVLLGAAVGAVLGIGGLVLLLLTGVRRRRNKRIAEARAAAWTPAGAETPAWPAAPAGTGWTPAPPAPAWPAAVAPAEPAPVAAWPPAAAQVAPTAWPPAAAPVEPAAPAPAVPLPPTVPPTPSAPPPAVPLPPPTWSAPGAEPVRSPWDPPAPPAG